MRPSRSEVLALMRELGASAEVVDHSLKVLKVAGSIVDDLRAKGVQLDSELVLIGALVHDLGRSRTHALRHGLAGAEIIRNDPSFAALLSAGDREALAKICERHLGAGIPAEDAAKLGLPARDFIPETLEEKIVAHADNLVWNRILTLEESRTAFEREFGKDSPMVKRIIDLGDEIERLAGRL